MNLKRIGCQYFMHYGEYNELTFPDDVKIVSIIGEWANEPKRSNRSGKSSFVEMIIYALYGETRAKKEIDLINRHFPNEDMYVELEFDNDIIIKRGRTASNDMILELSDNEGADKRVVQEKIDKLVGLSYKDFIMTSFFLQGDMHTFMEAGPTGQKQIISKWLEKDYWKRFEESSKIKQSGFEKKIQEQDFIINNKPDPNRDDEIKANIIILNDQKSSIEKALETLNGELEGIKNQLKKVSEKEDIEKSIKLLNKELKTINDEITEFTDAKKNMETLLKAALDREKEISELESKEITQEILDTDKEIIKIANNTKKTIQSALSDAKAEFGVLRKQYENADKFDAVCPVTKTECTSAKTITDSKEDARKKGISKNKEIKDIEKDLNTNDVCIEVAEKTYEEHKAIFDKIIQLKKEPTSKSWKDTIKSYEEKIKNKNEQLKTKQKSINEVQIKLDELDNIDVVEIESQKKKINLQIVDNKDSLGDIINNIAQNNVELEQIKKLRKEALTAEKQKEMLVKKFNIYKYITFMFGKNGIPSNQIETAFNEIEEEADIILEKMESGITMEFCPDRELDAWESNCLVCGNPYPKGYRKITCPECDNERQKKKKDELSIKITSDEKEIDFNLESGGGKVLISLAIRLAFVRMLQRRIGVNLRLIVFDEIFGMLDLVNRNHVFKLLTKTLIEDFDFNQILVISHEEEIRDVISDVIKVTRYNDKSIFNWD